MSHLDLAILADLGAWICIFAVAWILVRDPCTPWRWLRHLLPRSFTWGPDESNVVPFPPRSSVQKIAQADHALARRRSRS